MPALNFRAWLAPKVTDGTKPHTIRAMRKRPFVTGDALMMYTGPRMKPAPLPLPDQWRTTDAHHGLAWLVQKIHLDIEERRISVDTVDPGGHYLNVGLSNADIEALATRDGFEDAAAFWKFFAERGRYFTAQLIWFQNPRLWNWPLIPPGWTERTAH